MDGAEREKVGVGLECNSVTVKVLEKQLDVFEDVDKHVITCKDILHGLGRMLCKCMPRNVRRLTPRRTPMLVKIVLAGENG
jgi:hypothetical protein